MQNPSRLAFLGLFLCFSWRLYDRFGRETLRITMFDVGQGDSILLEFPGGKTLIIDAGGGNDRWNWGQKELFGELTRKGILTLDAALMTHPDRDHSFGFKGLFSALRVKEFWFNAEFLRNSPVTKELSFLAEIGGGTPRPFRDSVRLEWGGAQLELLPLRVDATTNNRALILKVRFGKCDALFVGDVEKAAEEVLRTTVSAVDILKVAHHGSHTSSGEEFLEKVNPQIALVSAGKKNQYGHPHRDVLERYWKRKIPLLRTDYHGFIELFVSKGRVECRTAQGRCGEYWCR